MQVNVTDCFDLQKIAESGQCFRVCDFLDGTYRFIQGEQVLYIKKAGEGVYDVDCPAELWESVWTPYFDLQRNYGEINQTIPEHDTFLKVAASEGEGIRIVRQDPWEMLITFIISQRKSIPAIKAVVELLSRRYGTQIKTPRETLYTFPTAVQLKDASPEDLLECKAGYRAAYIYDAVQQVTSGKLDLQAINALPDDALLAKLKEVHGVGDKVANCIALFAYGRTALAPVDTWIKKVIEQQYAGQDPFAQYGLWAGIMQQYLFYYAQQHKAQMQ